MGTWEWYQDFMDHEVENSLIAIPKPELADPFPNPEIPVQKTFNILCPLISKPSDEKWFYGLVARTFAKACESLGITKQTFSCQHKSHINKVMGHGTVGYCFDDNPELGGEGFLLGLHRCQSFN